MIITKKEERERDRKKIKGKKNKMNAADRYSETQWHGHHSKRAGIFWPAFSLFLSNSFHHEETDTILVRHLQGERDDIEQIDNVLALLAGKSYDVLCQEVNGPLPARSLLRPTSF